MPANKNGRLLQQEEYCNLKKNQNTRVEVTDLVLNISRGQKKAGGQGYCSSWGWKAKRSCDSFIPVLDVQYAELTENS